MANAPGTRAASAGGLSGWGESEKENAAIVEAADGTPPGEAGAKGGGTHTDGAKVMKELAPPRQQGKQPASGREAVAGMGEVEAGEGRNPDAPREDGKGARARSG